MKDFADLARAARRVAFDGEVFVAALRATFRHRRAQVNWRAFAARNQLRGFDSLAQVVGELRPFLLRPLESARTGKSFKAYWNPGGPWN
jgi:hypothetical protein